MAQLWGGRFTKETDRMVYQFNASIKFDQKLFEQDIEGSIAHVVMLEKQGILSCKEKGRCYQQQPYHGKSRTRFSFFVIIFHSYAVSV